LHQSSHKHDVSSKAEVTAFNNAHNAPSDKIHSTL